MKIGYACTPLLLHYKTTRKFQLKYYSDDILIEYISKNLSDLKNILIYNNSVNIKLFRISSDVIPFASHPINKFNWSNYFKSELLSIGDYIKENHMRVSMHPGQYTVLNSFDDDIVNRSILDLYYQTFFLDSLGLNETHKIILHIGGVYGDKGAAINRFINNYAKLDINIKNRLIIENDERSYSIDDVLLIGTTSKIPVIFDNLHNICFGDNNYNLKEILNRVKSTWKDSDGNIKVHYSQQDQNKKIGSHSKTIIVSDFLNYYNQLKDFNLDIMLEVKDKNVSTIKISNVINELNGKISIDTLYNELENYKLLILSYGNNCLLNAIKIIETQNSFIDFYEYTDNLIFSCEIPPFYKSSLDKAFIEMEKSLNSKEINHFYKLYREDKYICAKEYLFKLATRYDLPIYKTYYFNY